VRCVLRTPAIGTAKFTSVFLGGLAFALAVSSLPPLRALGQATGQQEKTTRAGSSEGDQAAPSGASENVNGEILQELERMRNRIQELEARLKQQSTGATADGTASGQQPSSESQSF
jgi:hypothetical protein